MLKLYTHTHTYIYIIKIFSNRLLFSDQWKFRGKGSQVGPSCQDQPGWAVRSPKVQPSLVAGRLAGSGSQDQPVLVAGSDPQDQPVLVGILKKKAKTTFTWPDIHRIKQQPCHSFPQPFIFLSISFSFSLSAMLFNICMYM